MDKKSLKNLRQLDELVARAQQTVAKRNDYCLSGFGLRFHYHAKNNLRNRQRILGQIAAMEHKKACSKIISKVFSKYNMYSINDFLTKIERLIQKAYRNKDGATMCAMQDIDLEAQISGKQVITANFHEHGKKTPPTMIWDGELTSGMFIDIINDFTKVLHLLLPRKVYTKIESVDARGVVAL